MRALALLPICLALLACQDAAEVPRDVAPVTTPPVATTPAVPTAQLLPAGRIEDIDFTAYSQDLAKWVGLEMGESRLDSIDKIRLYFAPEQGSDIVKLTSSTFERDDGSVLIFARNAIPDDSVKAQEVYAVFSGPGGDAKFKQKLAAFGMRQKCYRGENTTEWQTDLCP